MLKSVGCLWPGSMPKEVRIWQVVRVQAQRYIRIRHGPFPSNRFLDISITPVEKQANYKHNASSFPWTCRSAGRLFQITRFSEAGNLNEDQTLIQAVSREAQRSSGCVGY